MKSLDFSFNGLLMKLFKTTNVSIINDCRLYIGTKPTSELLLKRREKFLVTYIAWTIFSFEKCSLRLTLSISMLIQFIFFLFHLQYRVALLATLSCE